MNEFAGSLRSGKWSRNTWAICDFSLAVKNGLLSTGFLVCFFCLFIIYATLLGRDWKRFLDFDVRGPIKSLF